MNRLDSWRFGAATALTFSLLFTACALAFALSPEATFDFFNNWFHGLDLRLLKPPGGRALTFERYAYGLVGAAGVSFLGGLVLAGLYNMFSKRPGPR
jgi:hypothetical protein